MTWDGRKSQTHDPHMHIEFQYDGTTIGSYPYLMEAYFRKYPDTVLAVAGNYRFTVPGRPIKIDAGRSLARPNHQIREFEWHLHDGRKVNKTSLNLNFEKPGLYSEELVVWSESGAEDRDYLQVRVFDPERGRNMAYVWAYHFPVRDVHPGDEVLFWNRLINLQDAATIDFGDGSPLQKIDSQITHIYQSPGDYTASISATGPEGETVNLQMEVKISPAPKN